tara:strand:- start:3422 stop:4219 length:798 start_codon:yes stop_codon:yes gene_type:complete
MSKKKSSDATFVDPSDFVQEVDVANGETGELVNGQHTPENAWLPDTMGDPVGSEKRAEPDPIQLPNHYYDKYGLDGEGKPIFQAFRIKEIMKVFADKRLSPVAFPTEDADTASKLQEKYDLEVELVVSGIKPLLEIDAPTTGYNQLTLATRTWAEFVSIAYEYSESMQRVNPKEELPTWLIEREAKMWALGRKARMIRDAILAIDNLFGIGDLGIQAMRVQTEVERRQQRMAEWNYNKLADSSGKVASDLNGATVEHAKQMFASA